MNPHGVPILPAVPLVGVVGKVLCARAEEHPVQDEIDHVWIALLVADREIEISVNTSSKKNRLAGFDPRIRVGIARGTWECLPACGARACEACDYAEIESRANIFFEHYGRGEMEAFLIGRCGRACLLEAWGAPYRHRREGLHQIHSRRASCAVPEDIAGRDGALKFYYESGRTTELVLLKFCGQP